MYQIASFKSTFSKKLQLLRGDVLRGKTSPLRHPPALRKRDSQHYHASLDWRWHAIWDLQIWPPTLKIIPPSMQAGLEKQLWGLNNKNSFQGQCTRPVHKSIWGHFILKTVMKYGGTDTKSEGTIGHGLSGLWLNQALPRRDLLPVSITHRAMASVAFG